MWIHRKPATVVVIGAGQAGLSAGFHLKRSGFVSALEDSRAERTFVMFDANPGAGGAWQHRWESLTVGTLNAIFDLPSIEKPAMDPREPSSTSVPRYFAEFETRHELPILRSVQVEKVTRVDRGFHYLDDSTLSSHENSIMQTDEATASRLGTSRRAT